MSNHWFHAASKTLSKFGVLLLLYKCTFFNELLNASLPFSFKIGVIVSTMAFPTYGEDLILLIKANPSLTSAAVLFFLINAIHLSAYYFDISFGVSVWTSPKMFGFFSTFCPLLSFFVRLNLKWTFSFLGPRKSWRIIQLQSRALMTLFRRWTRRT